MSWDKRFVDPIAAPGWKPLVTVRDAATYITKLPKDHDADEWQAAMEALLLVVEHGGPPRWVIYRHVERVSDTSRKDKHWGSGN